MFVISTILSYLIPAHYNLQHGSNASKQSEKNDGGLYTNAEKTVSKKHLKKMDVALFS